MKKTLVAIAALTAIGAFAQSSVTLGGGVDLRLAIGNGDVSNKTAMAKNGVTSSKLFISATEDLGGGLKANIFMDADLNPDNGTSGSTSLDNQTTVAGNGGLIFGRKSTISLMGGWGEIRLGRDYTPHFWNYTFYDPFGTQGVASNLALTGSTGGLTTVRASNSFGYLSPSFGGFNAQVQTYLGENSSNTAAPAGSNAGSGSSLRLAYAQGPISVGLSYGKTTTSVSTDVTSSSLGGSYDLGVVKIMGSYNRDENTGLPDTKGFVFGVTAPVGSGLVKAAISQTDTNGAIGKMLGLGYEYNLSKRTGVYATIATISNSGGARFAANGATTNVNGGSTGFDLGVKHTF